MGSHSLRRLLGFHNIDAIEVSDVNSSVEIGLLLANQLIEYIHIGEIAFWSQLGIHLISTAKDSVLSSLRQFREVSNDAYRIAVERLDQSLGYREDMQSTVTLVLWTRCLTGKE